MKFLRYALVILVLSISALTMISTNSQATACGLSNIQISLGSQTSTQQQVIVTATPSCWSGSVGINRGNVDANLISVSVKNGEGSGQITKIGTTQEVHPYANNPGLRGNNVIIPCSCSGTGLTGLSITATGTGKVTVDATPSTWAGSVEIVTSTGAKVASVSVPSSPGHVTISTASEGGLTIHATYSGIVSNSMTLP